MFIREIKEITQFGEKRFQVKMEYNKEFIDKMKQLIPFPHRRWDPELTSWTFSQKGADMLRNIPGVVFYEDVAAEYVETSQFDLPEPPEYDSTIDYSKFIRPATDHLPELNPYNFQKLGISRVVNSPSQGLYYECGLGKTYTSICAAKELLDRKVVNQVLVISMVQAAIDSWTSTLDRMGYSYIVLEGPLKYRPSQFFLTDVDFVLTLKTTLDDDKYPLYTDIEDLKNAHKTKETPKKKKSFVDVSLQKENLMIIVDELHKLSNTQSKTFKCLRKIRLHCVRATSLTGTVIKSAPEKSLLPLRFQFPEIFSNKGEFENAFTIKEETKYGMKVVGYRNLDKLKAIIHKAGMPALKKDYLEDLPELLPQKLICCETDDISLELIDKIRNEQAQFLGKGSQYSELKDVYIKTHEALVCPSMFDPSLKATNRLNAVLDTLGSLDGKTVIFTTLKKAIIEIYNHLSKNGYGCTCCSGDQPLDEIFRRVDKFVKDPDCTVFITTIQKMGTGFDKLKIAQNAIIYDLNTNGADLIQAIDRLHRNGQKHSVSQIFILQDNCISEYQYEKVMTQVRLMRSVEDASKRTDSEMDLRFLLELIKDSSNFLRRK